MPIRPSAATPATLARDLIADAGKLGALEYLAGLLTWRDARPVLSIMLAVLMA